MKYKNLFLLFLGLFSDGNAGKKSKNFDLLLLILNFAFHFKVEDSLPVTKQCLLPGGQSVQDGEKYRVS